MLVFIIIVVSAAIYLGLKYRPKPDVAQAMGWTDLASAYGTPDAVRPDYACQGALLFRLPVPTLSDSEMGLLRRGEYVAPAIWTDSAGLHLRSPPAWTHCGAPEAVVPWADLRVTSGHVAGPLAAMGIQTTLLFRFRGAAGVGLMIDAAFTDELLNKAPPSVKVEPSSDQT